MSSVVTKRPQRAHTIKATTPAPYLGLNTVDSLADMDTKYGVSIQNFIATPQGLSLRQGTRVWATGLPGDVTTLIPYNGQNSSLNKLFAVSVSGIYDVTSGGTITTAAVSGLNSQFPYWQYASQTGSTAGKNFLVCVNSADAPQLYDGSTWTACTQVATPSAPGQYAQTDSNGNAVNINSFNDVILHQRRLWFVSNNTTKAYYTDVDTSSGSLYAFDFGPQFARGGKLFKLASWSVNTGSLSGIQAVLVAFSDKGDCVIYGGNDPSQASNFELIGTYRLGTPTGKRCTIQFNNDLLYLSDDGLYPLSSYLQTSTTSSVSPITTKIANVISDLIASFGTQPGFELALYPAQNALLLNVPQSNVASNFQFCFHTITEGWTQFTGWPATTWGAFNDALYFGTTGEIHLSFIGYKDGADINGLNGNSIVGTALTAFSEFDEPGTLKHVKLVKPYIVTGVSNPTISVGVNTDFNLVPITGSATLNPVTGAVWDTAVWDSPGATWVGSLSSYNEWITPLCYPGDSLAFAMSLSAAGDALWAKTAWIIEPGGEWG